MRESVRPDARVGTTVAGYRIDALLGRGGMGAVYAAHDRQLERLVALKILLPEHADDDVFRERFLRESRLAAATEHPNIVPVYAAGEEDGVLFIAMRLVEGTDLKTLLSRTGPLPDARAFAIVAQVGAALDAAHQRGLVHRDVKPANVLVASTAESERAYLADFGLTVEAGASELTAAGHVIGTVDYLAPERITGDRADARSDLYSLACLLYACLAGRPPFVRESDVATLWAHVQEEPPRLSSLRPDLPAALDDVVARGLAKEPAERFANAAELATAVQEAVVRPDRRRVAASPPPGTAASAPLPAPASSFVGRGRELAELAERLRGAERLVTLTGPGGSGKTRLAIAAAETSADNFPDGLVWVPLAQLRDPALVPETIGRSLAGHGPLAGRIGDRTMLLVLDNLEQVVDAAAELSRLLSACPNLRILATSREPLRVDGEAELALPVLPEEDAVALFCARTSLPADDDVRELCVRLDGLPLAIELAAARARALSPAQIVARLPQRLDALVGGRDADERHRTLRATMDWSHELLSRQERLLFGRLAVFAGGCTLELAEEVAEADLDTLQRLVEQSLVQFSGERYSMLETVRSYALEQLHATVDGVWLPRRHCDAYGRLLERMIGGALIPDARGTDGSLGVRRRLALLYAELDNFRAALDWALEHDRGAALTMTVNLALLWMGPLPEEGRRRLEQALRDPGDASSEARAHGLSQLTRLRIERGDYDEAAAAAREQLEVARAAADTSWTADAHVLLGNVALAQGDAERAELSYCDAEAVASEGEYFGWDVLTHMRGLTALHRGDHARAEELLLRELRSVETRAPRRPVANCLSDLGFVAVLDGRHDVAGRRVARALELAVEVDYDVLVAYTLVPCATLALAAGLPRTAAALAGAAEERAREAQTVFYLYARRLHDANLDGAEQALGTRVFAQALAAGRALTVEDAVACASDVLSRQQPADERPSGD